jgi:hypothetical protein
VEKTRKKVQEEEKKRDLIGSNPIVGAGIVATGGVQTSLLRGNCSNLGDLHGMVIGIGFARAPCKLMWFCSSKPQQLMRVIRGRVQKSLILADAWLNLTTLAQEILKLAFCGDSGDWLLLPNAPIKHIIKGTEKVS